MLQQFITHTGIKPDQINADEFAVIFREESRRVAGANMEDPRRCGKEALDRMVFYWDNPLNRLDALSVVTNYERPRALVIDAAHHGKITKDEGEIHDLNSSVMMGHVLIFPGRVA
jgi:hypothetical protein